MKKTTETTTTLNIAKNLKVFWRSGRAKVFLEDEGEVLEYSGETALALGGALIQAAKGIGAKVTR